eukprot:870794-Pelagomonas_calceolata.AAC.2
MELARAKPLWNTINSCAARRRAWTARSRFTCLSGGDMAVPFGRNHAPQSSFEGKVGSHIKKLNAGASPGLDNNPIPFLKHACLPIERGQRVDYVNVLVPLIARTFRVPLGKARIPACWKVAKLSPPHKKGALSNPGKYRIIAVSRVMYRIYANVLKDL